MRDLLKRREFTIITLSIAIIATTRLIYSVIIIGWQKIIAKSYLELSNYSKLVTLLDLVIFIITGITFLLYGWFIRRRYVTKGEDVGDNVIGNILLIFLIDFVPLFIFLIIATLVEQKIHVLMYFSLEFLETIQIIFITTIIGVIAYNSIEKVVAPFLRKEPLLSKNKKIGLSSLDYQIRNSSNKIWNLGLVVIGSIILLSTLIILIVYPSISVVENSKFNRGMIIAYPNFNFHYNESSGFKQQFFSTFTVSPSIFANWKVIQFLLSFIFLVIFALLYLLPLKNKKFNESPASNLETVKQNYDMIEINKDKEISHNQSEEIQDLDSIASSIIISYDETNAYVPSGDRDTATLAKRRSSKIQTIYNRLIHSDFIKVNNLAIFNLALGFIIIYIIQIFVPLSQITKDYKLYDVFWINLSYLNWAGVFEEISFRFLLFGLPLFVIYGAYYSLVKLLNYLATRHNKDINNSSFKAWLNSKGKENPLLYLTGRWKKFKLIDLLFLLISSFAFGYAHYQIGTWGAWKIIDAGIAGLIFGYTFYKYGLHAAMYLHIVNDVVIGLVMTPNLGLMVNGYFLILSIVIMGFIYVFYVTTKLIMNILMKIGVTYHRLFKSQSISSLGDKK